MAEADSCYVCCNNYGRINKKSICPYCSYECCSKCIETYTLGIVDDPHCMNCKNRWSNEILSSLTKKTFLNVKFYKHRKTVLINREKSYLPGYQEEIVHTKKLNELRYARYNLQNTLSFERNKEYLNYRSKIDRKKELKHKIEKNKNIISYGNITSNVLIELKKEIENFKKEIAEIGIIKKISRRGGLNESMHIQAIVLDIEKTDALIADMLAPDTPGHEDKKKFIRKCPVSDCNGFLSQAWKCGLCETWSCSKCFEVKGKTNDEEHVCTADNLATAELIRRDTKPCPKCGEMISKIDGCFAKDIPILMWDGMVKQSQDICIGDELVGDDGNKRVVQALLSGEDELYTIIQTNGISYTVNSKHTLVLKQGIDSDPIEITVDDYIKLNIIDKIGLFGYNINNRLTPISIESIGRGVYYGWVLDGNHRFVLEDLTCVKNCDQMWCITCHTPFSWNTGREVSGGVIHNPHYYQWLRSNGNEVPRNPLDNPCGFANHLISAQRLSILLRKYITMTVNTSDYYTVDNIINNIMTIHRKVEEINHDYHYRFTTGNIRDEFKEEDVKFLVNLITEKQWESSLVRIEKKHMKFRELNEVFDAFKAASVDVINSLNVNTIPADVITTLNTVVTQMNNLKDMTNKSLKDVLVRYNSSMYVIIEHDWKTRRGW